MVLNTRTQVDMCEMDDGRNGEKFEGLGESSTKDDIVNKHMTFSTCHLLL